MEEAHNQQPAEEDNDGEKNLLPHVGVQEDECREDVDSSQSCPQVANLILTVIVQLQCSFIEEENGDERANDDHEEDTVAAIHDRKYEKARKAAQQQSRSSTLPIGTFYGCWNRKCFGSSDDLS